MEKSEKVNETDRESACSWPLQISAPPICLLSDNYVCLCTAVSAHFLSILHSRSFTKPLNNDYLSLNLSFLLSLKLFSYIPSSFTQFSTTCLLARVPAEWAKEEEAILSSLCFPASYNETLTCCVCLSSDLGVRMPSTCIFCPRVFYNIWVQVVQWKLSPESLWSQTKTSCYTCCCINWSDRRSPIYSAPVLQVWKK